MPAPPPHSKTHLTAAMNVCVFIVYPNSKTLLVFNLTTDVISYYNIKKIIATRQINHSWV